MTSSRTAERWTMATALFLLISQVLLARPADAAPASEALLPPTPLVLKDGRIANVSIHILPFVAGETKLAGDAADGLARLTSSIANDCFLTAQVIGHVSSAEVTESETLAAHRLARSRADAVQASLIGGGLPAKAIASVWDWQFLVREPRATLWLFRLIEGEDCEGAPLDGDASQLVAEADETPPAVTSSAPAETPRDTTPASRTAEAAAPSVPAPERQQAEAAPAAEPALPPIVSSAVAAEAIEAPGQAQAATQAEQAQPSEAPARANDEAADAASLEAVQAEASPPAGPRAEAPQQASIPAGPAEDIAVPVVTQPLPALSPSQDTADSSMARPSSRPSSDDTTLAALQPGQPAVGDAPSADASAGQQGATKNPEPGDPERQGKVEWSQDGVVITFATNSSYFPPGTSRRLKSLLDRMAGDASYRVQLQVGVSGADTVVGATSPEEAKQYNKWLAERRLARVQEWLSENAVGRPLEVEPEYLTDDSSRRVVVRIAPAS
jgi:hypothetical protein